MNEKTKNSSKIIFRIVAILLCLVLITASVVSSTLAKFTVTKEATTEVSFKTFGVKMQIKNAGTVVSTLDSNSVTVTYPVTEIYPGYDNKNLVLFTFDGTLTVPATLTVTINVELADEFYISSADFESLGTTAADSPRANGANMPVYFNVGSVYSKDSNSITGNGISTSWAQATDVTILANNIEKTICSNLRNSYKINGSSLTPDASGDYFVTKDFAKNYTFKTPDASDTSYIPPFGVNHTENHNVRYGCGFGIGINWPMNDIENKNVVETWIADKIAEKQAADSNYVPMTITITVSLEQTGT